MLDTSTHLGPAYIVMAKANINHARQESDNNLSHSSWNKHLNSVRFYPKSKKLLNPNFGGGVIFRDRPTLNSCHFVSFWDRMLKFSDFSQSYIESLRKKIHLPISIGLASRGWFPRPPKHKIDDFLFALSCKAFFDIAWMLKRIKSVGKVKRQC